MADNKIIVPEKKIITNATLADRAVAFISALKHTKGEWHGKNFELLPWQEKVGSFLRPARMSSAF